MRNESRFETAARASLNYAFGYLTAISGWAETKEERESADRAIENMNAILSASATAAVCEREAPASH